MYTLYLDETGLSTLKNINPQKPFFVLAGIVVKDENRGKLENGANLIKFKFWSKINIVFHSVDIGKRKGPFKFLTDPAIEKEFLKLLFSYLTRAPLWALMVNIDKKEWKKKNPKDDDVYKIAVRQILESYLLFLTSRRPKRPGRIVIESSAHVHDLIFYKMYNALLSGNLPIRGLTREEILNSLTSLSFVRKENFDIEEQIADLFAYVSAYKCMKDKGLVSMKRNSYEQKMWNILNSKLMPRRGFIKLP